MIEYTVKVYDNGDRFWDLNGKRHREDGPAIEWADGSKEWLRHGNRHREDGPAIECSQAGVNYWYLDGVRYTEEEFNKKMAPVKDMTVAEISKTLGYEVRIVK